jgi:hypothetical protein
VGKILAYGASRTTVDLLFGGRGILLANLLGPESFGIWALFRVGLLYCAFSAMGLLRGLELEVSHAGYPSQSAHTPAQSRWGRLPSGRRCCCPEPCCEEPRFACSLFFRASRNLRRFAVLELAQSSLTGRSKRRARAFMGN